MASCTTEKMIENDVDHIIRTKLTNQYVEGYVKLGEDDTYMPMYYMKYADSIKNLSVQNSDVIVASYPKAGTTWTQEMVWLIANNFDFEGAKIDLPERFPFLEICTLFDVKKLHKALEIESPKFIIDSVEFIENQNSPRFIKTHLPFSLLPDEIQNGSKSPKIIYVMRNPKDVCVSYYHHGNILQGWVANLEDFAKVFSSEKIMYGSYWKHVLGYWEQRNLPNLLIITYEDMKKDLPSVINRVATFLDKTVSEEQMELLTKHLSFESMKSNKAVNFQDLVHIMKEKKIAHGNNSFIRSGKVGKYKEELSPEIIEKFDLWSKKCIGNTGFDKEYGYIL